MLIYQEAVMKNCPVDPPFAGSVLTIVPTSAIPGLGYN